MRSWLFFIIFTITSSLCQGLDWANDFNSFFVEPSTMARGRVAVSLSGAQRQYSRKASDDGGKQALGGQRTHTLQKFGTRSADIERTETRSIRQEKLAPMYVYGLTSVWSVAFRVSIIKTDTDNDVSYTYIDPANSGKKLTREAGAALWGETTPSAHVSGNQVGTAEVLNKQLLIGDNESGLAIYENLKFPSAQTVESDYAVTDLPEPRGFGFGMGTAAAYQLSRRFKTQTGMMYVHNFEDTLTTHDSLLSTSRLEKLHRQPGADFIFSSSVVTQVANDLSFNLGWLWQSKSADEINTETGKVNGPVEYESLAVIGVGLKPQAFEIAKEYQFGANLNYYSLLAGRNVADANTLGLDLQVLF